MIFSRLVSSKLIPLTCSPTDDPEECRKNLVASGALVPILFHLDLTLCSLQTVRTPSSSSFIQPEFVSVFLNFPFSSQAAVVGLILENLAATSTLLSTMLELGTAGTLMTCVFEDLPVLSEPIATSAKGSVRRTNQGRHDSMSPAVLSSSASPGDANGTKTGKGGRRKPGKKTKDSVAGHMVCLDRLLMFGHRKTLTSRIRLTFTFLQDLATGRERAVRACFSGQGYACPSSTYCSSLLL